MRTNNQAGNTDHWTLITGASSGIGRAFAAECARRGMNLMLIALPGSGLPGLCAELETRFGIRCRGVEKDLGKESGCHEVFAYVTENNLQVHALINNVGVGFNGLLEDMPEEEVADMLTLNIRAATLLTRLFLPTLRSRSRAHILNVGSLASFMPLAGKCVYSASKAYVYFFTRALRHELGGTPVSVSGIFPSGVPTNDRVRQRIAVSGWLGRQTTTSPEKVAREGIDGMLRGREIIFPGRKLKAFFLLASLLPQGLIIRLLSHEFIHSR
jgi:hypothetical protein